METSIDPPADCKTGSLVCVKLEEGVDRTKMEKSEAPSMEGLENTDEKRGKKPKAESERSQEQRRRNRSITESVTQ